jgi:hypothetical protein
VQHLHLQTDELERMLFHHPASLGRVPFDLVEKGLVQAGVPSPKEIA